MEPGREFFAQHLALNRGRSRRKGKTGVHAARRVGGLRDPRQQKSSELNCFECNYWRRREKEKELVVYLLVFHKHSNIMKAKAKPKRARCANGTKRRKRTGGCELSTTGFILDQITNLSMAMGFEIQDKAKKHLAQMFNKTTPKKIQQIIEENEFYPREAEGKELFKELLMEILEMAQNYTRDNKKTIRAITVEAINYVITLDIELAAFFPRKGRSVL